MDAGILPQAGDFVLQLQFASLEFRHLQIIRRRMCQRLVEFIFESLVAFFEFRKMRLNGHVACLLASVGDLTQKVYTTFVESSTLVWVVHRGNPPIATVKVDVCAVALKRTEQIEVISISYVLSGTSVRPQQWH